MWKTYTPVCAAPPDEFGERHYPDQHYALLWPIELVASVISRCATELDDYATMSNPHEFGGVWTQDKLDRLRKYLTAYMKIFRGNVNAAFFTTVYVDAFAGTGYRESRPSRPGELPSLFDHNGEHVGLLKGSAHIALETAPPFDHYMFIEERPDFVAELESLRTTFPELSDRIQIVSGEANESLRAWCSSTDWTKTRAVVFLDPYGMEIDWATIEKLGATGGVDLWLLFPLGQAVNRMLTKAQRPPKDWADRLTRFFGTEAWMNAFYEKPRQMDLFGDTDAVAKDADYGKIERFFVSRLQDCFAGVAPRPRILRNSKNIPLYLLCFAASNKKKARLAVGIANHILGG